MPLHEQMLQQMAGGGAAAGGASPLSREQNNGQDSAQNNGLCVVMCDQLPHQATPYVAALSLVRFFPPSVAQQPPYSITPHMEPPRDSRSEGSSAAEVRTARRT